MTRNEYIDKLYGLEFNVRDDNKTIYKFGKAIPTISGFNVDINWTNNKGINTYKYDITKINKFIDNGTWVLCKLKLKPKQKKMLRTMYLCRDRENTYSFIKSNIKLIQEIIKNGSYKPADIIYLNSLKRHYLNSINEYFL